MKVAINGFGRIGRAVFKIALERGIKIAAINDIHGIENSAYLLKYDSVYGNYNRKVSEMKDGFIVGGKKILFVSEPEPRNLPWRKLGVELVIEATGIFTDRKSAAKHFEAGAGKVLITAPAEEPDVTIVPGANEKELKKSHQIISLASCTTNCLAPIAKILDEKFGIERALFTTVHSYTASQGLQDSANKKMRRGRAGGLNIIPTTTGAAKAVIETLPHLNKKINGMAMRVPVACGSIIDLVAELKKKFDVKLINKVLKDASRGRLKKIVNYTEDEIVSSDVIGSSYSAIVDGLSTQQEGNLVKVLAWYDNEWGYSCRVVDVIGMLK